MIIICGHPIPQKAHNGPTGSGVGVGAGGSGVGAGGVGVGAGGAGGVGVASHTFPMPSPSASAWLAFASFGQLSLQSATPSSSPSVSGVPQPH